ncbi:hypothetical protein Acr_20g0007830 [Actinidia rufa]|uniref:Uncharacterized protein n=1 Tax=Actinidia rufa TaxID=165716 RepID=A0A7J0GDZ8_9ERIC|nr:hypothetical protein Acr_20g0007830 [Actinidia rufa]
MNAEVEKVNLEVCCVSEDLDSENSNLEWSEKSKEVFNCIAKDSDILNPKLSETRVCDVKENSNDSRVESTLAEKWIQMTPIEPKLDETQGNIELHNVDQKSHDNGNLSSGIYESTEELVQMTPPNANIFPEPEVNDNGRNKDDSDIQPTNRIFGNISGNYSLPYWRYEKNVNRKNSLTLKSKLILDIFRDLEESNIIRPYIRDGDIKNLAKWWRISLRTANQRFFLGISSETRPDLVGNALPTVNRRWGLWLCEICLETDLTRLDSTPMRVDLTSKGFLFAL